MRSFTAFIAFIALCGCAGFADKRFKIGAPSWNWQRAKTPDTASDGGGSPLYVVLRNDDTGAQIWLETREAATGPLPDIASSVAAALREKGTVTGKPVVTADVVRFGIATKNSRGHPVKGLVAVFRVPEMPGQTVFILYGAWPQQYDEPMCTDFEKMLGSARYE